jgi:hypothetical protein
MSEPISYPTADNNKLQALPKPQSARPALFTNLFLNPKNSLIFAAVSGNRAVLAIP